jgi:diguanylate cyclase (GGDEF)-like protein
LQSGECPTLPDVSRRLPGSAGDRKGKLTPKVALIALLTAAVVGAAGGGQAFWLCLPGALLASAAARRRSEAVLSAAVVVAGAGLPFTVWPHIAPVPSPLLALLTLAASLAITIAVRERLERERDALRNVALSDPLTGIANRRVLLSRAEYEIARHRRAERSFAVVMLDLDGFKLLNDRFGHAAGDELLCDVAAALTQAMRAQDTVARIGGDEFCVLAPETDGPHTVPLAHRIAETVAEATAGIETLSASVGVAVFPDDGVSAAALLQAADARLLAAKRERTRPRRRRRAA